MDRRGGDTPDIMMAKQYREKHPVPSVESMETFKPTDCDRYPYPDEPMWKSFCGENWTYKLHILKQAGYSDSDLAGLDVTEESFAELEERLGIPGLRAATILILCKQLENMHRFATRREDGRIHVFGKEEGCWLEDGEQAIKSELQKYCPRISTGVVAEIVEKIRQRNLLGREEKFVGALVEDNMLHVDNGWLDMDTLTLEPHTPDRLSVAKLPTPFDRDDAAPEEFVKMIMEALPDIEYRRQLLKVMGNLLIPDARYEKATMFAGEGHNRKSSVMFALGQVLGEENCCSVSPQEMSDDRFAAARLRNKMANLAADLSADRIKQTGRFKTLTSGDLIEPQEKYGQPFKMHNTAKSIFSANSIPPSDDQSYAFFRKWCIIPFFRQFERDPTLQKRLSTSRERAGILKLMLAGRKLLLKEGFDETSIERVRFLYNKNASVSRDFLEQECIIDLRRDDYQTKTTALLDAYNAYLEKKGSNNNNGNVDRGTLHRQLGRELDRLGVENRQRGPRQKRERYYLGIILKSELEKSQERLTP